VQRPHHLSGSSALLKGKKEKGREERPSCRGIATIKKKKKKRRRGGEAKREARAAFDVGKGGGKRRRGRTSVFSI